MFSQQNPVIGLIRRELRGKLPDEWLEEVIGILEYQLTYQTLDELATNDLLKLRLGLSLSPALNFRCCRRRQHLKFSPWMGRSHHRQPCGCPGNEPRMMELASNLWQRRLTKVTQRHACSLGSTPGSLLDDSFAAASVSV